MNILNHIWSLKQKIEYSLSSITYNKDKFILEIEHDVLQASSEIESSILVLKERSSHKEILIQCSSDNAGILNIEIKKEYYAKILEKGNWDVYVQINHGKSLKKIRVKNTLVEKEHYIPFYIQDETMYLAAYSTIRGNLTFKSMQSISDLYTELVSLGTDGKLNLSGYFFIPSWNVPKHEEVKKSLIIMSNDGSFEKEILIENSRIRNDITKLYGQSSVNYDWSGYDIELDLKNNSYEIENDKSYNLYIKMYFQDKSVMKPINATSSSIHNSNALVETSEGLKKILVSFNGEDNNLSLLLTSNDIQAEVDSVYSEDGCISIFGRIITTDEYLVNNCKEYGIVLKNRDTDEEYNAKIELNDLSFSYTFDLTRLFQTDILTEGVWDLYLKFDHRRIRMVTRLDNIENKQKLIHFPQQLLSTTAGNAMVIKPYYTLHDELSLLVRNYIAIKSIKNVIINRKIIKINGKLNIQPPNTIIPEILKGSISFKGMYGMKYNFPVEWKLVKTNKTSLEFNFSAQCTLSENVDIRLMQRDINFDLFHCQIVLDNAIADFTMNIDSSKLVVNLEDRLRQKGKINSLLNRLGKKVYLTANKYLPINSKTIIFQSFHGKSYACNPKAIYEELLNQNVKMNAIWVLNNLKQDLPGSPTIVRPHSIKYYYYMATAKYFVNNGNFPDFYIKRNNTIHLQTWHGTPLKKLGFDIDPNSPSYYENTSPQLLRRNSRWDYLVAPNQYTSEILKRAFRYKNTMLNTGYPRNDILLKRNNEDKVNEIKKILNIDLNKKVILYAPTWRDYDFHKMKKQESYKLRFNLDKFKEQFGDEYVLLLRLHYRDASRITLKSDYDSFVYNVSSYDDIQELYLISDILITDYSSVMFDFANSNKPILFYTYDLKRYDSEVRGFYMNFEKNAPGPMVLDEDHLFYEIKNINKVQEKFLKRYQNFREMFCHLENGQSSQRVVNSVFKGLIK